MSDFLTTLAATHWNRVPDDDDAGEGAGFVETWTPRIGDRVRVRLNPECPQHQEPWLSFDARGADGMVGVVRDDLRHPSLLWFGTRDGPHVGPDPGHWWVVYLGTFTVDQDGTPINGIAVSAAEIEPASASSDDAAASARGTGEG